VLRIYPKTHLSILSSSKGFVVSSAERCGLVQAPVTLRQASS
jgi:hypothetical protein